MNLDLTGMAEVISEAVGATIEGQKPVMNALVALIERDIEPPTMNITVPVNLDMDVKTQQGKTTTTVKAFDDKGRILQTETDPVYEDED